VNFDPSDPLGLKILKGVKIVTFFSYIVWPIERDEIWHNVGYWCVGDLKGFW